MIKIFILLKDNRKFVMNKGENEMSTTLRDICINNHMSIRDAT